MKWTELTENPIRLSGCFNIDSKRRRKVAMLGKVGWEESKKNEREKKIILNKRCFIRHNVTQAEQRHGTFALSH